MWGKMGEGKLHVFFFCSVVVLDLEYVSVFLLGGKGGRGGKKILRVRKLCPPKENGSRGCGHALLLLKIG